MNAPRRTLCLESRELAATYGRSSDAATGFQGCASLVREPSVPAWLRARLDRAIAAMHDVMEPLAIAVEQRREEMLSVVGETAPGPANDAWRLRPCPACDGQGIEAGKSAYSVDWQCRRCSGTGQTIADPRRAPTDPAPPDPEPLAATSCIGCLHEEHRHAPDGKRWCRGCDCTGYEPPSTEPAK